MHISTEEQQHPRNVRVARRAGVGKRGVAELVLRVDRHFVFQQRVYHLNHVESGGDEQWGVAGMSGGVSEENFSQSFHLLAIQPILRENTHGLSHVPVADGLK